MTPAAVAALPRLRPEPWPVTPLGPYRLREDGKLEQFRTIGDQVIEWIEANCVFTDGKWVQQPVRLLDWQKQLLLDLFEVVYDPALERWRLRYRTALIGVPKKQGKTELVAFIALWFLFGSGFPSPGIPVAAAAEYQADLVFGAASRCVEMSPTLSKHAEVWAKEIRAPRIPNGMIRKVAASGGKLDGMKALACVYDELHEWLAPNQRKLFGMLRGALALADEPMNLMITTAGEDDGEEDEEAVAPWLRMYRFGRRVESGEVDDPAFFFRWWMAPPGCDHKDLSVVMDPAVNPSAGVTVQEAFYRDELTKRTESEYRRYYFNQPVESLSFWLPWGSWEECEAKSVRFDKESPTYLGWDASTKRDSTAVVLVQVRDERVYVKSKLWERPWKDGAPDEDWRVPRNDVLRYVRQCYERYNVVAGGYDPAQIAWVAEDFEDEGLALYEWPQSDARMVPATQALFEAVIDKRLVHDGDLGLQRHIRAVRAKETGRGQRLVKPRRGRKIDAAIALCIAIAMMEKKPEPPSKGISVYIPGEES